MDTLNNTNQEASQQAESLDGSANASPSASRSPEPIDINRCLRGARNIYVSGAPNKGGGSDGSRTNLIEEAVSLILKDGKTAMAQEFLGFKQYAHFGDQRCDCPYGMGPRHGSIVFEIGRAREARSGNVALGADEIYLLECIRDFGSEALPSDRNRDENRNWNLLDILHKATSLRHDYDFFYSYLVGARVDEQCADPALRPEGPGEPCEPEQSSTPHPQRED
jgi:hypothetical protein